MRKVLISAAAAVSALAFAAPAAAQYYPAPPPGYGNYGQNGDYGYNGYGNNYGSTRNLQVRIDRLQQQINRLDRQNLMSERSADRLRAESRGLERRLRAAARYGLNPHEANDINRRIAMLEQRVRHDSISRRNAYGYNGYNGYNGREGWSDRDRDGRNDCYENDRGRDHDD